LGLLESALVRGQLPLEEERWRLEACYPHWAKQLPQLVERWLAGGLALRV
jgi:hypothetical protein